jgi:hypothetical protein
MELTGQHYGTTETKELLVAMGGVAVIVAKAQKAARGADGKINGQALGQAIAAEVMSNPKLVEDLKSAAAGIADVPKELKDLSLVEIFDLLATAGQVASACAAQI